MLLSSLKVLDFSTLLPGPFATRILADLGADVIRIEHPSKEDLIRQFHSKENDTSITHRSLNRSKRSLTLDLKKSEANNIIERLIQTHDIIVEQFRPGVMDRLGLGYAQLKSINPKLIYCSISGYGATGVNRERPGHDINFLARSGIADFFRREGEKPIPLTIQLADVAGGSHYAVMAILSAVIHRMQTGEGQFIDISMTDACFSLNSLYGSYTVEKKEDITQGYELLNGGSYYDYYETKDGRYFSVGSLEPHFQKEFCEVIERLDLLPMMKSTKKEDVMYLKEELNQTFKEKTFQQWQEVFQKRGICVEPVLTFLEASKQLNDRDMIVEVPLQNGQFERQIALPIKFSKSKPTYSFAGCKRGEHSSQILKEIGFTDKEIASFRDSEVFSIKKEEVK